MGVMTQDKPASHSLWQSIQAGERVFAHNVIAFDPTRATHQVGELIVVGLEFAQHSGWRVGEVSQTQIGHPEVLSFSKGDGDLVHALPASHIDAKGAVSAHSVLAVKPNVTNKQSEIMGCCASSFLLEEC